VPQPAFFQHWALAPVAFLARGNTFSASFSVVPKRALKWWGFRGSGKTRSGTGKGSFVTGHDFSRAGNVHKMSAGFSPCYLYCCEIAELVEFFRSLLNPCGMVSREFRSTQ
jgi:hypothetical protein